MTRQRPRPRLGVAACALALLACSGGAGGDVPDGGPHGDAPVTTAGADGGAGGDAGPVTALFDLDAGAEYYALPFPNDLRRRSDGTIDMDGLARAFAAVPLLESYVDVIAHKTAGFGTNSAVFFRFSGALDPATLPATPSESLDAGASVYLVDVDPASPARGVRVPLELRFEKRAGIGIGANWLSCLPVPGFPLRPATTYAAVVTRRVRGVDGTPVRRAPAFDSLVAGTGSARAVYQPLLDILAQDIDDVAAAAVFTTQDPVSFMQKIRQVVYASGPAPIAADVVAKEATAAYQVYEGSYPAPIFQSGTAPYLAGGGEIVVGADGLPVLDHVETLRFAVTVPRGATAPDAGWPIVIYAHGTGGDFRSFIGDGTAGRLAAEGLAVISIDQVMNGPRDPSGGDGQNFFNFQNPVAARDNVRQGGADDFQLLRVARDLVLDGGVGFDGRKIFFFGHSQGGLTGPPFLAAEPDVSGAVLSGAAGLIYLALLEKREPIDIAALVSVIIPDRPLDRWNSVLALVQMFIEPGDPVNYGPLLVRTPLPGVAAKNIYQSEGFVDHFAPDDGIEAFGVAMGLEPVLPLVHDVPGFALRGIVGALPAIAGNAFGKTAVFAQYDAGPTGEGHFVVFDDATARRQSAGFLGTLARTGVATLAP